MLLTILGELDRENKTEEQAENRKGPTNMRYLTLTPVTM